MVYPGQWWSQCLHHDYSKKWVLDQTSFLSCHACEVHLLFRQCASLVEKCAYMKIVMTACISHETQCAMCMMGNHYIYILTGGLIAVPFSFFLIYITCLFRYLYLGVGGCLLAVISMGWYSAVLFVSVIMSAFLIYSMDPKRIHRWVFVVQMSWQSFWHMFLLFRIHRQEPAEPRYFRTMTNSVKTILKRFWNETIYLNFGLILNSLFTNQDTWLAL